MDKRSIDDKPADGQLILAFGNILDDFGNFVQRGYGIINYQDEAETFKHAGLPAGNYFVNHIDHYYSIDER